MNYLELSNLPKNNVTKDHHVTFRTLARADSRVHYLVVDSISDSDDYTYYVEANLGNNEIIKNSGYSLQKIAGLLHKPAWQCEESRKHSNEIIDDPDMEMDFTTLKGFKHAMLAYQHDLPPSAIKAQCYRIAGYRIGPGSTIASTLDNDHSSADGAKRAAKLMVEAGCAIEYNKRRNFFGTFLFKDGSELK